MRSLTIPSSLVRRPAGVGPTGLICNAMAGTPAVRQGYGSCQWTSSVALSDDKKHLQA